MTSGNEPHTERHAFSIAALALSLAVLAFSALVAYRPDLLLLESVTRMQSPYSYQRNLKEMGFPEGQWISGVPSHSSFKLPMPLDTAIREAVVRLDLVTDAIETAVVTMTVTVNGRRSFEQVVKPGRDTLHLKLPITEKYGEHGGVRVAISLIGTTGVGLCNDDGKAGVVIHVLPTSGVDVALEEPVYTVRDTLRLMPERIAILLPVEQDRNVWLPLASALGLHLRQMGYQIAFKQSEGEEATSEWHQGRGLIVLGTPATLIRHGFPASALTGNDAATIVAINLDGTRKLGIASPKPEVINQLFNSPIVGLATERTLLPRSLISLRGSETGNVVSFADLGVDTDVQQVRFRRSWAVTYAVPDMPGATLPESLRLNMHLAVGPRDVRNFVHIELNGNLIASREITEPGTAELLVDLPRALQRLRNRLLVTLQRHEDDNECSEREPYPVQILPTTALLFQTNSDAPGPGFLMLAHAFASSVQVLIPDIYTVPTASNALSALLPVMAEFLPLGSVPDVRVVDSERQGMDLTAPFIAYRFVPPGTQAVVYQPLSFGFENQRIVVDAVNGEAVMDIGHVNKVLAIELVTVRTPVDPDNNVYRETPGLVLTHTEQLPGWVEVDIGTEDILVFPDGDAPFEIVGDGKVPALFNVRQDGGFTYSID